jgi:3-oxoacyl-[acyl-carrier-protein] synthase-1
MMTAVGLTAAETAASVRAGAMRFEALDYLDKRFEPFTLATVPDDGLPPLADGLAATPVLTGRERRMLRLATAPLQECVAPVASLSVVPGLCLALPESETGLPLDRAAFVRRLAAQVSPVLDAARTDASHAGRAGGLIALGQAVLTIQQGDAEFMVAGGVDSYKDLYVLGMLDREERVRSDVNVDAFIPGEAAAFLLLTSARVAGARGLTSLGRVSQVGTGFEAGHMYSTEPYRGDGLAAALAQLVAAGGAPAPIGEVYSSMNGENHWAKEWGVCYLRNRDAFLPVHRIHHPADSFGDTGAACGPLMVGLAALGIARRYRRSPALVYGSSDRGPRAALVVSAS